MKYVLATLIAFTLAGSALAAPKDAQTRGTQVVPSSEPGQVIIKERRVIVKRHVYIPSNQKQGAGDHQRIRGDHSRLDRSRGANSR
jgi:hypothetical protein